MNVRSLVTGPDHHGAVRHARTVAALCGIPLVHRADPGDVRDEDLAGAQLLHAHFTERLWGHDAAGATVAFEAFADRAAAARRPVVVSAHDVPDPDGDAHDRRRSGPYGRVLARAAAVVVASEHERARVRRLGSDADVVRLPVVPVAGGPARSTGRPGTVTVLGFVYPGKGHDDVLAATAQLAAPSVLVCAGAPSPGHEDLPDELQRHGGGTPVVVTGALDERAMQRAARCAAVPVVPARNPSASASLATWLACGRRPLVAASPYARELAALDPGLVTLYDPADPTALASAITAARRDPASTWRTGALPQALTAAAVATGHRAVFERVRRAGSC